MSFRIMDTPPYVSEHTTERATLMGLCCIYLVIEEALAFLYRNAPHVLHACDQGTGNGYRENVAGRNGCDLRTDIREVNRVVYQNGSSYVRARGGLVHLALDV